MARSTTGFSALVVGKTNSMAVYVFSTCWKLLGNQKSECGDVEKIRELEEKVQDIQKKECGDVEKIRELEKKVWGMEEKLREREEPEEKIREIQKKECGDVEKIRGS